jgi:hypothetical protein
MKNRNLLFPVVFVAAALVAIVARILWFYPISGRYSAPDLPESTFPRIESLSDDYDAAADLEVEGRVVLIDTGHSNEFDEDEMSVPLGRLTTNGADVKFVGSGTELIQELRRAYALVVLAPSSEFSSDEVQAIKEFVGKGGRLVVFGEPTRQRSVDGLNSLANAFGVTYLDDYVYNMVENDGGFRNVIFTRFADDVQVTEGLDEVVFQTAYSLRAVKDQAIILGDRDTFSSSNEIPGDVIVAALAGEARVLFMPDITFLTSPYNTFADNDVLLDNIVAFALTGERIYDLEDFPYFFDTTVQVVYEEPATLNNTLDDAISLRTTLTESGLEANLAEEIETGNGLVYLALYENASDDILDKLEADGITLSDEPVPVPENGDEDEEEDFFSTSDEEKSETGSILVEGFAHLDQANTVLIHLVVPPSVSEGDTEESDQEEAEDMEDTEEEAEATEEPEDADETSEDEEESEEVAEPTYEVILLATSEEVLVSGIDRLLTGDLQDCLITSFTAVCKGEESFDFEPEPEFEFELTPEAGTGNVLVVADDEEYAGSDEGIGSARIADTLEMLGYTANLRSVFYDGMPAPSDLQGYDAVFWMVGENCCSAPSFDSVDVLIPYLDDGGRLFIEGGSVAFTLNSDGNLTFLEDYLGASYYDFGDLIDLEVAGTHPLTAGLPDVMVFGGFNISLSDVIQPVGNAEVILYRGPDSSFAGEPAMVAKEDDSRVVFAAFTISFLEDSDLESLLLNAMDWFSSE